MRILYVLIFVFTSASLLAKSSERWLFLGDSITQAGFYVDYVETWLLLNEEDAPEIIDLGLGSETVSGLSEPDHPFPRPCLHTRLDRVLERVKPDVVIACYGMNCGIYHPFSKERFAAYKKGIKKLIDDAKAAGAEVILLTPPPFAGRVQPKQPPEPGEPYGFKTPASDYNEVLGRYAGWILSLDGQDGVRAFNTRPAIEKFMEACYPNEPVHPNQYGHTLMGEAFLRGLGKDTQSGLLETGVNPFEEDPEWEALLKLVQQQRETYDRALLNDIGHGNPGVQKKFPTSLEEAEALVRPINVKIEEMVSSLR